LASLRELERVSGKEINPLRFRANIYIENLPAWAESDWIGSKLAIGSATLEVMSRTERCAATNVDPETAERDMAIPAILQRHWGHADFGIYAQVTSAGQVSEGDRITSV
ncbi:MAG: MOSC domain-containing protein, partial [Alphaproteobacteria bacterium]|nr:MOSC domain-containing protein [Alphaproteobacteria bacterium]